MPGEDSIQGLRELIGVHHHMVYQAMKEGKTSELSHEGQLYAKVIEEHLHLRHVHNALEFADVREGQPYEIEFSGQAVSPLAHLAMHLAVEQQIEESPDMRAAYGKLLATGVQAHHAKHILMMILSEVLWEVAKGHQKSGPHRLGALLKKISNDSSFRKKWVRRTSGEHPWGDT